MIKKSGAKKSVTKAAVKKNPPVKTAEKVEAKPTQAIKGDQTSITENKNEKVKNLPNLDAFAQSFDDKKLDNADKTGSSDKADKVDEAAKAAEEQGFAADDVAGDREAGKTVLACLSGVIEADDPVSDPPG